MSIIEMPVKSDLEGRIVMLNLEKCKRFQCPNFSLSPNNLSQMVPPKATLNPSTYDVMSKSIQAAIYDGRLLDVTNQTVDGLKVGGNQHTPVKEEDTDLPKVILGHDKLGRLHVITPRDKAHEVELLKELLETGTISSITFTPVEEADVTSLSPIRMEELPTPKVIITDP